jgi:hypothetical protein
MHKSHDMIESKDDAPSWLIIVIIMASKLPTEKDVVPVADVEHDLSDWLKVTTTQLLFFFYKHI